MESPDLGYVRYFHDHPGCDGDQCGIPDPATRIRGNSCRCTMGTQYLCFIVGCNDACLWLFSGPFWDQARLSFWIGCLRHWLLPVRTRTVAGMVDRCARPAGIWGRGCATFGSRATLSRLPAKRAGDCTWILRHRSGVRACPRSDFGRLVGGCQSLAADLLHQYPRWDPWCVPGFTFSA